MATVRESMDLLKAIIGRGCDSEQQRRLYSIEWTAFNEVLHGDPYNETPYHHANERYTYRAARERAAIQQALQG